jgi:hypothetical protein
VKQWNKCIDVDGGYIEKKCLFLLWISHILCFISICDLFTGSPL